MKGLEFVHCYHRNDYFTAYHLTQENANDLLNLMGYSQFNISKRNEYGDNAYGRIVDGGIEYGSRFGHYTANYGDYILDFDGIHVWRAYSPDEFRKRFCKAGDSYD